MPPHVDKAATVSLHPHLPVWMLWTREYRLSLPGIEPQELQTAMPAACASSYFHLVGRNGKGGNKNARIDDPPSSHRRGGHTERERKMRWSVACVFDTRLCQAYLAINHLCNISA
jgi:hypothetical protein